MRAQTVAVAAAALLYLALRVAVLQTSFDAVAIRSYEIYPHGTIAKLIAEGTPLPIHLFYDNTGGPLLVGVLTAPLYAALGDSYLVLKLVPLALGLLTLLVIHALVRDAFSARAGILAAFLFAITPVALVKHTVTAWGIHSESLFFVSIVLWSFYRLHAGGRRTAWLAATGFSAGFALFVFLGVPIVLVLLALVHVAVCRWRRSAKDLAVVAPAFALGLSPWIYLNVRTGGRGIAFLDGAFRERGGFDLERVATRFAEFLGVHARDAGCFESVAGIPAEVFSWAFFGAFVASYALAVRETARAFREEPEPFRRWHLVPFLGILPLTACAYAVSGLHVANYGPPLTYGGYRYLLPHLLAAVVLIAAAAGALVKRPSLAVAIAAAALGSGVSSLALVDADSPTRGAGAKYAGYDFAQLARILLRDGNGFTPESIAAFAARLEPAHRHQLYEGLGSLETLVAADAGAPPAPRLAAHPSEFAADLARGAGRWLRFAHGDLASPDARDDVERVLLEPSRRGDPLAARAVEGACVPFVFPIVASETPGILAENERLRAAMPPELVPAWARGEGLVCGRLLRRGIAAEESAVAELVQRTPEPSRAQLLEGLALGLADGAAVRDARDLVPPAFDRVVPAPDRAAALEALGRGLRHVHGTRGADEEIGRLRAVLDPATIAPIERGARLGSARR